MTKVGDYIYLGLLLTLQPHNEPGHHWSLGLGGSRSTFIDLKSSHIEAGTCILAFLVLQPVFDMFNSGIIGKVETSCSSDD